MQFISHFWWKRVRIWWFRMHIKFIAVCRDRCGVWADNFLYVWLASTVVLAASQLSQEIVNEWPHMFQCCLLLWELINDKQHVIYMFGIWLVVSHPKSFTPSTTGESKVAFIRERRVFLEQERHRGVLRCNVDLCSWKRKWTSTASTIICYSSVCNCNERLFVPVGVEMRWRK